MILQWKSDIILLHGKNRRKEKMNLGLCTMASSSSGNCYLIKSDKTNILLDAGIACARVVRNFEALDADFKELNGVLLTHEHIDHVRGVKTIHKKAPKAKFYATEGTAQSIEDKGVKISEERLNIIGQGEMFNIDDIEVTAFEIPHDSKEPVAYSFCKNEKKITIVTDAGEITPTIENAIMESDILVIEANHEVNILLYGRYPYNVKRRILSDRGHLSNEATGKCICNFLKNQTVPKTPHVLLAHLSKENNTPEQAMLTISNILEESDFYVGKHLKMEVVQQQEMGELIII